MTKHTCLQEQAQGQGLQSGRPDTWSADCAMSMDMSRLSCRPKDSRALLLSTRLAAATTSVPSSGACTIARLAQGCCKAGRAFGVAACLASSPAQSCSAFDDGASSGWSAERGCPQWQPPPWPRYAAHRHLVSYGQDLIAAACWGRSRVSLLGF